MLESTIRMSGLIEHAAEDAFADPAGRSPFRFNANAARAVLKACPLPEAVTLASRKAPVGLQLEERVVCLESGGNGPCGGGDVTTSYDNNDGSAAWLGSAYDTEQFDRPAFSGTSKFVLRVTATVFFGWQLGITIAFAVLGFYDMSMFTFWNYTLLTIFFAWLLAALIYERWLLTGVLLFALPIMLGTTFIVWVSIVIIVARNEDVFLGDGSTSVAKRHTGDWVVHDVPPMMMLITLALGFSMYARRALGYRERLFRTRTRRLLYVAYWLLSPLIPLGIYSLAFDIAVKYPTGIATGVLWVMLIGLCVAWQAVTLGAFTVNADVAVRLSTFKRNSSNGQALGGSPALSLHPTATAPPSGTFAAKRPRFGGLVRAVSEK